MRYESAGGGQLLAPGSRLRVAIVLPFCALLMWLAIAITFNFTLAARYPATALALWPWSAYAKIALANDILTKEPDGAGLNNAEALAMAALGREPANAAAASTLALVKTLRGDQATAGRLMHYSESQSRRDLPTQLWLIEEAVGRDDIPAALVHYDRALRTSRAAAAALLPTLVSASDDPQVASHLARILSQRPLWWPQFIGMAVADSKNPVTLDYLMRSVRLDIGDPTQLRFANAALARLIQAHEYRLALSFYTSLSRDKAAATGLVRNGDFSSDQALLPFDWWFAADSDLSARREADAAQSNTILSISASGGRGGEVARQLIVLDPGRYRIQGRIANSAPDELDRPFILFRCDGGADIAKLVLPTAGGAGAPFQFELVVPPQCAAQWLSIRTAPAIDTSAWIDSITITGQRESGR